MSFLPFLFLVNSYPFQQRTLQQFFIYSSTEFLQIFQLTQICNSVFLYFFTSKQHARRASLVGQMVKNLLAMQETCVQFLGGEDPLEKGMATHSSILAWRIPWTEDLEAYSPWSCKELDMTEHAHIHTHTNTHRRCDSRSKNLESCEEGS